MEEETGLTISKPQLCGIKDWYDDADYRYVVLFYKTEHFTSELQSSGEGKVWWEDFENLSHLKLATEDMSDMLRVFLEEDLSEFFYSRLVYKIHVIIKLWHIVQILDKEH